MNTKQFEQLLTAVKGEKEKEKKEEEPALKSQPEIKVRKGKTFYDIWMEGRDE